MSETGRVTLITGASAGIGAELARVFAARGHRTALVARRVDRLEALAGDIGATGPRPIVIARDLRDRDAGDAIGAALAREGVEPDHVVNNAGYGLLGAATDRPLAAQLEMIDVNVRALTELSLRFAESLARHRGGILNVASLAGFLPGPNMAVYYATKAFVVSFSEALHHELGPRGIRVTALCPGPVPTEFQDRAGIRRDASSLIARCSARAVAEAGYRGVMKGRRLIIPGRGLAAIPMLVRLFPRGAVLAAIGRAQARRD